MEENNVAVQLIKTIENLSFDYLKHNPGSSPSLFILSSKRIPLALAGG